MLKSFLFLISVDARATDTCLVNGNCHVKELTRTADKVHVNHVVAAWVYNEWELQPLEIRKETGTWKKRVRNLNDQTFEVGFSAQVMEPWPSSNLLKGDVVKIEQLLYNNQAEVCVLHSNSTFFHGCEKVSAMAPLPFLSVPQDKDILKQVGAGLSAGKSWYHLLKKKVFSSFLGEHTGVTAMFDRLSKGLENAVYTPTENDLGGILTFLDEFLKRSNKIGIEDIWRIFEFTRVPFLF